MQGQGELNHPKVGGQMTAVSGYGFYYFPPDLAGQVVKPRNRELFYI